MGQIKLIFGIDAYINLSYTQGNSSISNSKGTSVWNFVPKFQLKTKSNFVHFSLKVWHLVASNLLIFVRINWRQCVKSTAKFGGLATIWGPAEFGGLATIWGSVPLPPAQRGTATGSYKHSDKTVYVVEPWNYHRL